MYRGSVVIIHIARSLERHCRGSFNCKYYKSIHIDVVAKPENEFRRGREGEGERGEREEREVEREREE